METMRFDRKLWKRWQGGLKFCLFVCLCLCVYFCQNAVSIDILWSCSVDGVWKVRSYQIFVHHMGENLGKKLVRGPWAVIIFSFFYQTSVSEAKNECKWSDSEDKTGRALRLKLVTELWTSSLVTMKVIFHIVARVWSKENKRPAYRGPARSKPRHHVSPFDTDY